FEGSLADITERLHLEAQLRHAHKMESVGQLAGGVAHDFNNILTIIKGHADLMLSGSPLPEPLTGSLEKITAAADRAASLTRQMLTFSRQQIMQPRVLDLNQVIHDSASGLEQKL